MSIRYDRKILLSCSRQQLRGEPEAHLFTCCGPNTAFCRWAYALWQKTPKPDKLNPYVALHAAHAFNQADLGLQSKLLLEAALHANWDERLVAAYAICPETCAQGRIAQAERWHERHPSDATLLSTLGMLCIKDQLWGKAKQYLERSLALEETAKVHILLASMAEHRAATETALDHYKRAALLASAP